MTPLQKIFIPLVIIAVLGSFSLFTVNQWEQAVVFEFKKIKKSDFEPGLHFMKPFVNTASKFEKRLLNLDQPPRRFLTSEKKDVIVDYYAKWRISDVRKFYIASNGGNIEYAKTELISQSLDQALRDEFGKRTVQEVVAGERDEILKIVTSTSEQLKESYGIEIVDVRTKRIDLPDEVSEDVYKRMRSDRVRVAEELRAQGKEAAERIQAVTDRDREVILAKAYRDAEINRGEGDAQATEIYAAAYGKDREFYSFYRSLDAYKSSFNSNDILLLDPKSDFFKYFNNPKGN
ncbi:MAG TPA: protease modulator HflC [Thiotrichaceae bacterium]|jgi:membrane protease subunit HflC|nr:protease modulator HflC [Thiotrichaceae bacterium]HIM08484.1 protease modulator HflC [Gammaproteobacteria bacterium]